MASRMDRYYDNEETNLRRNIKNRSLYDKIQDVDSYSNMQGIATIDKNNEIDITTIKELLRNRENYLKEKKYNEAINNKKTSYEAPVYQYEEDNQSYDIKDALIKARTDREEALDEKQDIKNTQYNILKSLQLKDKDYTEDKELKKLIDSITNNSKKKSKENEQDLLDDLKSDTVVGNADSIQSIIDKEKSSMKVDGIDNSFYTSSLGFTKNDFDDLKDISNHIKKNNLLIKVLIVSLVLILLGFGIYFVFNMLV